MGIDCEVGVGVDCEAGVGVGCEAGVVVKRECGWSTGKLYNNNNAMCTIYFEHAVHI